MGREEGSSDASRAPAFAFGALNLLSAALVGVGVFGGLPERYAPVDGGAVLLMAMLAGAGLGLLMRTRWCIAVATVAAAVTLALGLVMVCALALSASFLAGIYGPVGRGGMILFLLVLALVIPYLVVLPGAQLVWLRRVKRRAGTLAAAFCSALVVLSSVALYRWARLSLDPAHPRAVVASVWRGGELVARALLPTGAGHDPSIDEALATAGGELVLESIVGEGPIVARPQVVFALSLVSGHDGVMGQLDGVTAYVTPDDLLAHRAYDRGTRLFGVDLPTGADTPVLFALLAERLHATARRVESEAVLHRIRVARTTPLRADPPWAHADEHSLSPDMVRGAAFDAALYLARNIRDDGHFHYLVEATSGKELAGYDWPRHGGATFFLAQAADHFHDPRLATACLRAASLMRDRAVSLCGDGACIGTDSKVDLGSSALGLLAFVEIARTGLDPTYADLILRLSRFIRAQQRPDGEFMHEYDRRQGRPVDVQYVYYSGEATLALSRAYARTHDPADLAAATRGLAHLVGPAWRFFGDRYYFGEEHWTCQAMADLWAYAKNPAALDFCGRWQAYNRRLQYRDGETPYDAVGGIGVGSFATPRLTPVASRCEAGVATLDVLLREHPGRRDSAVRDLERQQRRALALLVRRQLRPGPTAILANPERVYGAMPGSEVDLALRIDYAQHAGSAMLRWIDLEANAARSVVPEM
jgi:hypothetical protein